MKTILIIILTPAIVGLIYFFYLGYKSQNGSAPGLVNSKLSPCPDKPNCICTEFADDQSHFTDAIKYQSLSLDNITNAIESTGGIISTTQNNYIAATYTSRIFKYVDDFEIRIDSENQVIHIRSASRVGHSDIGANLKRIENFKNALGLL